MKLTSKHKLIVNQDQSKQLIEAMITFNKACDYISEIAFKKQTFNKFKLHHLVYKQTREIFNLPSQMTIRAIGKVVDSYADFKKRTSIHRFKRLGSINYDNKLLTIKDNIASISTLSKRIKVELGTLPNKVASQCELIYDKPSKKFFINFVKEIKEQPQLKVDGYLGVDLGIVNIATCSNGTTFTGKRVEQYRKRMTLLKARLQKKGTKSAKRHLKRLSKKEQRYKKDVNHCVSKAIVLKAKALNVGIKLEKLKIKQQKKTVSFTKTTRDINGKFSKWAFSQLRSFIDYKAKIAGVPLLLVNPAFTSQQCSGCNYTAKENRKTQAEFICIKCGLILDADYNAAINISRASINKPIVTKPKLKL